MAKFITKYQLEIQKKFLLFLTFKTPKPPMSFVKVGEAAEVDGDPKFDPPSIFLYRPHS